MLDGLDGKKVKDPPEALTVYELCKTFKCLPSQLEKEDNKTIEEFLVIMNAIAEHDSKESKKNNREDLKKKLGKGGTPR